MSAKGKLSFHCMVPLLCHTKMICTITDVYLKSICRTHQPQINSVLWYPFKYRKAPKLSDHKNHIVKYASWAWMRKLPHMVGFLFSMFWQKKKNTVVFMSHCQKTMQRLVHSLVTGPPKIITTFNLGSRKAKSQ